MNRRDLLKLGASIAAVAPAAGQPAVPWKPELFDDHQDQSLIALIDLIIPATDTPGAKEALVNRHIDHILAASPEDEKTQFREGLWWVDGYAIRKHGKPFTNCTREEQTAILEKMDAGTDPEMAPGHRFFGMLKGMTSDIYYATQIGFRELNKGGRAPASFGCRHSEHT